MDEIIFEKRMLHRDEQYTLRIIKKSTEYLLRLSLDAGENIREFVISTQDLTDNEKSAPAETFREFIEAEERWIKDNR